MRYECAELACRGVVSDPLASLNPIKRGALDTAINWDGRV